MKIQKIAYNKIANLIRKFGIDVIEYKDEIDSYYEVGYPPNSDVWWGTNGTKEAFFVKDPPKDRDSYDDDYAGYLLHEFSHMLAPGSINDDEMRCLVIQHMIIDCLPFSLVRNVLKKDFEGYGYPWEDSNIKKSQITLFNLVQSETLYYLEKHKNTKMH